jgi:hypothetical protein
VKTLRQIRRHAQRESGKLNSRSRAGPTATCEHMPRDDDAASRDVKVVTCLLRASCSCWCDLALRGRRFHSGRPGRRDTAKHQVRKSASRTPDACAWVPGTAR